MGFYSRLIPRFRISTLFYWVVIAALLMVMYQQRQELQRAQIFAPGDIVLVTLPGVLPGQGVDLPEYKLTNTAGTRVVSGFPIAVLHDGTIVLPYVGSVTVQGKSLAAVKKEIKNLYATRGAPALTGPVAMEFVDKRWASPTIAPSQ